ncbi:helix-turn-helix transcriptional regulator [Ramlibacter rhizophilus]|uniref:helix-turn-helix transcriptional regulator n=1 Tax=Ramlibacter rhizophilus TaxID=1781167 RepID=UPI0014327043|nr:helix-turn-helix transcriptional regulator [Ramlibacter rhizophilus]
MLTAPAHLRPWFLCVLARRIGGAQAEHAVRARIQANSYACINVISEGDVEWAGRPLPRVFVAGPFSRSVETVAPGALLSASLVMQPWLLWPLLRVNAESVADGVVPVTLEPRVHQALDAVARTPADHAARTELWTALGQALGAPPPTAPALALDALRSHGLEAAAAACGFSSRQYRRRFQQILGLAPARWLRITRWERAVSQFASTHPHGSLADVSINSGYADQAHMTREIRELTNSTPGQLRNAMLAGKESWSLEPARVRILQDVESARN